MVGRRRVTDTRSTLLRRPPTEPDVTFQLIRLSSVLSVGRVVLMCLVEELFRQLKLSQMLTRMTVAVD